MADNTQQDAARQAAEAVQASGRATSEAARRGSEFAADATVVLAKLAPKP
ncbi:MAG: hypothetical protein JOY71_02295 [Acetobacteraceae bacterium]|nr:hypothetical protein [Acetobacteraceae bacterium]